MKLKNILKTTGALHILLGLLIIFLLIFSVETIAGDASSEALLLVRGTADVVAASNLGIGCLLIICSSIKDKASLRKVLSGELSLMFCFLAVALFNTFNAGTIVDGGPPTPFWIVLKTDDPKAIYQHAAEWGEFLNWDTTPVFTDDEAGPIVAKVYS